MFHFFPHPFSNRSYNRHCHRVSELFIGLCIRNRNNKAFRKSLQSSTLSGSKFSRRNIRSLVNQYLASVLVVSGRNCICVFRISIEKAESKSVALLLMFSLTSNMALIQFLADGVFFINIIFKNISESCLLMSGLGKRKYIFVVEPVVPAIETNNIDSFSVLWNAKISSTQNVICDLVIKCIQMFNVLLNGKVLKQKIQLRGGFLFLFVRGISPNLSNQRFHLRRCACWRLFFILPVLLLRLSLCIFGAK